MWKWGFRTGLPAVVLIVITGLAGCSAQAVKARPPPVPVDETAVLAALAPGLPRSAISEALAAVDCAKAKGIATSAQRLAIVDYSRPSREQRLWVFDLERYSVLFRDYVAHGRGSGLDLATAFSNRNSSHQTSLGLFLTDQTYQGGNGYSLKLHGLSGPLNDLAFERKIVMHGAGYVDPDAARRQGRLGRSFGCPALRPQVARRIIDTLKEGQFLYAYGPGSRAAARCTTVALASRDTARPTPMLRAAR